MSHFPSMFRRSLKAKAGIQFPTQPPSPTVVVCRHGWHLILALAFSTATPTSDFLGTSAITVTASDTGGNLVEDTFDLTVIFVVNREPIAIEQVYRVAADVAPVPKSAPWLPMIWDGDDLTFTITDGNAEGHFAIDANSGVITTANVNTLQAGSLEVLTIDVSDGDLSTSTTATIYVTAEPVSARYTLRAFDTDGNEVSTVTPGQEIDIRLFVQDTRDAPRGAFSAYVDLVYPPVLGVGDCTYSSRNYLWRGNVRCDFG